MQHVLNQVPQLPSHWNAPSHDILNPNCACQIVPFIPSSSLQVQQGIPDSFHPGFPGCIPARRREREREREPPRSSNVPRLSVARHKPHTHPTHPRTSTLRLPLLSRPLPPPPRNASQQKQNRNPTGPSRRVVFERAGTGICPIVVCSETSQSRTLPKAVPNVVYPFRVMKQGVLIHHGHTPTVPQYSISNFCPPLPSPLKMPAGSHMKRALFEKRELDASNRPRKARRIEKRERRVDKERLEKKTMDASPKPTPLSSHGRNAAPNKNSNKNRNMRSKTHKDAVKNPKS